MLSWIMRTKLESGNFKSVCLVHTITGTITDSFTYKIVDKYKKYSTAKVTIYYKCSSTSSTSSISKPVANADIYSLSPCSKCAGNVLSNDKGSGLKIATTGYIKTAKGVKVYLKRKVISVITRLLLSRKPDWKRTSCRNSPGLPHVCHSRVSS